MAADDEATRITRAYTGKTLRSIVNPWIAAWESAPVAPLPMPLQPVLVNPVLRAAPDDPAVQNNAAGQIAGLVHAITPAAEVVREMAAEADAILREFAARVAAAR